MQPNGRKNSPNWLASSGDLSSPGGAFFVGQIGAARFGQPLMNRFSLLFRVAIVGAAACSGAVAHAAPAATMAAPTAVGNAAAGKAGDAFGRPLTGDAKILNALNRLTFGPRPGDLAAVKRVGLQRWIDAQINASAIDDGALQKELSALKLLNQTPDYLLLAYQGNTGKIRRAYEQQQKAGAKTGTATGTPATFEQPKPAVLTGREEKVVAEMRAAGVEPTTIYQAMGELTAAKLARATDSKRQLQEVLVDFWSNHFNLDVNKNRVVALKMIDDRDAIRPNVLGNFRALLGASAHSPAMLIYLDNASSTADSTAGNAMPGRGKNKNVKPRQNGGLNENYGREIMELHTLGVDGGYTQRDVTEVARAFTGWGVDRNGAFSFRANAHDNGAKTVLGHVIPAGGGQEDGELVLDILAAHPATARHIAFKLCQRFIADAPPPGAVDAVAAAFTRSNGDLKRTYAALFATPEFNSWGAYRAKIKSPLEFAVSAMRALDGTFALPDPDNPRQRQWLTLIGYSSRDRGRNGGNLPRRPLAVEIAAMGQPLWGFQAPTGYPENSQSWVSSSALIARLNFALALTTGRIGDVRLEKDTFRNTSVGEVANDLLSEPLSPPSRATIEDEIKLTPADGAKLRALILGSPEFQRR